MAHFRELPEDQGGTKCIFLLSPNSSSKTAAKLIFFSQNIDNYQSSGVTVKVLGTRTGKSEQTVQFDQHLHCLTQIVCHSFCIFLTHC